MQLSQNVPQLVVGDGGFSALAEGVGQFRSQQVFTEDLVTAEDKGKTE